MIDSVYYVSSRVTQDLYDRQSVYYVSSKVTQDLRNWLWSSLVSDLSANTVSNFTTHTAVVILGTMSAKFFIYWYDVLQNSNSDWLTDYYPMSSEQHFSHIQDDTFNNHIQLYRNEGGDGSIWSMNFDCHWQSIELNREETFSLL